MDPSAGVAARPKPANWGSSRPGRHRRISLYLQTFFSVDRNSETKLGTADWAKIPLLAQSQAQAHGDDSRA